MLFGFYRLTKACLRYNFSFVLDSHDYKNGKIKIILYPDDIKASIILEESGYGELFEKAVKRIAAFRMRGWK